MFGWNIYIQTFPPQFEHPNVHSVRVDKLFSFVFSFLILFYRTKLHNQPAALTSLYDSVERFSGCVTYWIAARTLACNTNCGRQAEKFTLNFRASANTCRAMCAYMRTCVSLCVDMCVRTACQRKVSIYKCVGGTYILYVIYMYLIYIILNGAKKCVWVMCVISLRLEVCCSWNIARSAPKCMQCVYVLCVTFQCSQAFVSLKNIKYFTRYCRRSLFHPSVCRNWSKYNTERKVFSVFVPSPTTHSPIHFDDIMSNCQLSTARLLLLCLRCFRKALHLICPSCSGTKNVKPDVIFVKGDFACAPQCLDFRMLLFMLLFLYCKQRNIVAREKKIFLLSK